MCTFEKEILRPPTKKAPNHGNPAWPLGIRNVCKAYSWWVGSSFNVGGTVQDALDTIISQEVLKAFGVGHVLIGKMLVGHVLIGKMLERQDILYQTASKKTPRWNIVSTLYSPRLMLHLGRKPIGSYAPIRPIQIRDPIRSHLFWDKTAPCLGKWLSAETCSRCWSHYHHIFQDHLKLDIFIIEWCWYLMAELSMLLHLLWLRYTKRLEGALPVWDGFSSMVLDAHKALLPPNKHDSLIAPRKHLPCRKDCSLRSMNFSRQRMLM